MTLTEIVMAMNIGVLGVLGLHQAWVQQAVQQQQHRQVQQARGEAFTLLASWQHAPSTGNFHLGQAQLISESSHGISHHDISYNWQLRFPSYSGHIQWQGSWHVGSPCE